MITISHKEILFGIVAYGFITRFGMFFGIVASLTLWLAYTIAALWLNAWALEQNKGRK